MKITLNREKYGMLFMDDLPPLTYDEPGPVEIDLSTLSSNQFEQLKYNFQRGAIVIDKPEALERFAARAFSAPLAASSILPEPVMQPVETNIDLTLRSEEEKLKKILTNTVPTIKKLVPACKASEIRKLLKLELSGKKRKSLVQFLTEAKQAHTQDVIDNVGEASIDLISHANVIKGGLDLGKYSTNITDIVDSEIENVTIKTANEE